MRELLRMEVETQTRVLVDNLLALEKGELTDKHLEAMMRAAHSVKGGARIADLPPAVELAHVMEDLFVAARAGKQQVQREQVDALLQASDLLTELAQVGAQQDKVPAALLARSAGMCAVILALAEGKPPAVPLSASPGRPDPAPLEVTRDTAAPGSTASAIPDSLEWRTAEQGTARTARVSIDSMNRLMNLVGELTVKGQLTGLTAQTLQVRRRVGEMRLSIDRLQKQLAHLAASELALGEVKALARKLDGVDEFLRHQSETLETHDAQMKTLTRQMQREVMANRMQAFGDVAQGFRRLARHLEQGLGKELLLEISGTEVGVDRDILERLNVPLTHLIQNAADHGIESAAQRAAASKPLVGRIQLTARHHGGRLSITVEDDGRGIDLEALRHTVAQRKLVSEAVAASLGENELLEFLFLPNFSLREQLSDISGRGVGLDLVRHTLQEMRGTVRMSTRVGVGTRFEITLPVTLIVVRCLVVDIAGDLFALPVGRIVRALRAPRETVLSLESRQYLPLDGQQVGLVSAAEVLGLTGQAPDAGELAIVMLAHGQARYALVVDRLLGEQQLVERPLDPRLGKVEDVSSMALLENASPVLMLDVDDVLHSIERLASGRLRKIDVEQVNAEQQQGKRVLVVDDSITVREVERGLLTLQGYVVDVAVDGAEGWNALRTHSYDLLVSDVDMPRMDGVELIRLVRADERLKHLPVIIISYKDREEDRMRGLDAGADRYLTKGSFQDDTFIQTVADMLGQTPVAPSP